jgi:DNA-binding beta-propeller fold protein YncE
MRLPKLVITYTAVTLLVAPALMRPVVSAQTKGPAFAVDKLWPMPLPNHWVYGSITGLAIDSRDHIFVATRPGSVAAGNEAGMMSNPPTGELCCLAAPPILEFDADGKLVNHWGAAGEGYQWPTATGGIALDGAGNIFITAAGVPEPAAAAAGATGVVPGANRGGGAGAPAAGRGEATAGAAGGRAGGRGETVIPGAEGAPVAAAPGRGGNTPPGPGDAHILKFTRDGKFVLQIGKAGEPGPKDSQTNLDKPADVFVDGTELYVADGGSHQRVVVFDATTGAFKRQWRGNGAEFQRLSSIAVSKDGLVYVGDRKGNKIQIFKKDGAFVKELAIAPNTLMNGSVWDVNFSSDAKQTWLFVADGQNSTVRVFTRATLAPAGTIGDGGRWPGRFYAVNNVAMDSKGNLYTGEGYEGKRVQKFLKR